MLVLCHFVRQDFKHDVRNALFQHVGPRANLLNLSDADKCITHVLAAARAVLVGDVDLTRSPHAKSKRTSKRLIELELELGLVI